MGLKVIDGEIVQPMRQRRSAGVAGAHDKTTDQAGPGAGGDRSEVAEAKAGFVHYLSHKPRQVRQMGARGDLGHDAAEGLVVPLTQHRLGQDRPVLCQSGGGSLVT